MENREIAQIPYFAFEGEMARSERHIKRLWIAIIVLAFVTVITNVMWIWYISQYDYTTYDYEQSNEDGVNVVGEDNEVDYGISKSDKENKNT